MIESLERLSEGGSGGSRLTKGSPVSFPAWRQPCGCGSSSLPLSFPVRFLWFHIQVVYSIPVPCGLKELSGIYFEERTIRTSLDEGRSFCLAGASRPVDSEQYENGAGGAIPREKIEQSGKKATWFRNPQFGGLAVTLAPL